MKFPLNGILMLVISYLSTIIASVLPEKLDPKQKVYMQTTMCSVYAVAKNFGQMLVVSTENDLDDQVLKEVIETCEEASAKYGIELNAKNVTPGMVTFPIV